MNTGEVTLHFWIYREHFEHTVKATHVGGGLCIHKPVEWKYGEIEGYAVKSIDFFETPGYCVTHQKSGTIILQTRLLRDARWRMQQLHEIRPVWDMDYPGRDGLTEDEYRRARKVWEAALEAGR